MQAITVCVENNWISFKADWVNRKKVEANKTKEVWPVNDWR
jgi:hypothetical protein